MPWYYLPGTRNTHLSTRSTRLSTRSMSVHWSVGLFITDRIPM